MNPSDRINRRFYYLAPAYSMLMAAGAVTIEIWTAAHVECLVTPDVVFGSDKYPQL